jgi:phosphatidylglycerophosphatase A
LSTPSGWIACGFGSGLSPWAPGTMGSLAALLPWLALRQLPMWGCLLAIAGIFVLGIWVSNRLTARLSLHDPGCIVIDEFVGQWLALCFAPAGFLWIVAGFVLFRIFDVWKPWPVSWADRNVGGGLGVMLDDVVAGVVAAIVLAIFRWIFPSI